MHRPPLRVLVHVEDLPKSCYPAQAFRREHMTLLWIHPGTSMAEVAWWVHHNLTADERTVLRHRLGMDPDLSVPVDDSQLDGTIDDVMVTLPTALRVPGDRPVLRSA